jgi:hypothetical protein
LVQADTLSRSGKCRLLVKASWQAQDKLAAERLLIFKGFWHTLIFCEDAQNPAFGNIFKILESIARSIAKGEAPRKLQDFRSKRTVILWLYNARIGPLKVFRWRHNDVTHSPGSFLVEDVLQDEHVILQEIQDTIPCPNRNVSATPMMRDRERGPAGQRTFPGRFLSTICLLPTKLLGNALQASRFLGRTASLLYAPLDPI